MHAAASGQSPLLEAVGCSDERLAEQIQQASQRTADWLVRHQQPDGHWCGELEGDSILESEYVLLMAWLGLADAEPVRRVAAELLRRQLPCGGWAPYPGGPPDVSASVKAYLALKLTGWQADAEPMRRAAEAIQNAGGPQAVNSFTRFYLALLGLIDFDLCPAVVPEMLLLPRWFPLTIYKMSAWSRTIFVPLAIVWAHRPRHDVGVHIDELYVVPSDCWPALRSPGFEAGWKPRLWEAFFRYADRGMKIIERLKVRPWRRRALAAAETWIRDRSRDSDGLGAIFPPIVWSAIAYRCLGYALDSEEVQSCLRELEALMIHDGGATRLQPCKSPVWDTALSVRALAAAVPEREAAREHAVVWLREREVRCEGDWSQTVSAEPAGWFFEYRNAFYPDVDDTTMVLMALADQQRLIGGRADASAAGLEGACQRGIEWIRAMQNRDGGWGAFDRDNDRAFLCYVPFADHNAMIDPSTPDITGRVLEAWSQFGIARGDAAVERAISYLRRTQEADGSWFGRWGVNYIYGTWQVLVGLRAAGVPCHDPAIQRGGKWLLAHQQPCGGWGESCDSYLSHGRRGEGVPTASQTAWALLGLHAAGLGETPAFRAGVTWLLDTQQPDGSWIETEFTGTGFPRVFYLRYHMYPIYFPLLALAAATRSVDSQPRRACAMPPRSLP